MATDPQLPDDHNLSIGDHAHVEGDVFSGDKRVINTQGGPYIEKLVIEGSASPFYWNDLRDRALLQTKRAFGRLRAFIPEIYVARAAAEASLAAFLASPRAACLLLGPAGSGKTSLLRHWAQTLLAAGQAVFFYDCGGSVGVDVQREILRDLLLEQVPALIPHLPRVSQLAGAEAAQVIVIFDAINEFRGGGDEGPDDILRNLDALVEDLPDANVRLVLSCNTTTWERLERRDAARLAWSRYYGDPDRFLRLSLFEPAELEQAYPRYQAHFRLKSTLAEVPAQVREQLRSPLLLRLMAEAYQDKDEPIQPNALTLEVYERYFNERVKQRQDQAFVLALAAEMLRQKRAALLLSDLEQDARLGPEIVQEDKSTSYYRVLDAGLLTETSPNDLPIDTAVKFTYTQVGAYALALALHRTGPVAVEVITSLLADARAFPLAYDTARVLLSVGAAEGALAALAQSPNLEQRELAVDGLLDRYVDQPSAAGAQIEQLLSLASDLAQRTALKAAYRIGEGARAHFISAALQGSPELRAAARDTLYLIGQENPQFVFSVLDDLASRISYKAPRTLVDTLSFILDLSITLYINQCEREGMIQQTSDLWHKVLKDRLHLDRFDGLAPVLETVLVPAVSFGYSGRLVSTLTEFIPPEQLFRLSDEQKALFERVLPCVDPAAPLDPAAADLAAVLQSGSLLCHLLGALVLAVHACRDFAGTEPLLRSLFDRLPPTGRLAVLLGFSVLLPGTPPAWVDMLEEFTRRLCAEHAQIVFGETPTLLARLDLLWIPLGLAYAKRGPHMPFFVQLIQDALERNDQRLAARCLSGLGPLGFYYPVAVFETLRGAVRRFDEPALEAPLVSCLGAIRLLHVDAVDAFLAQIGAAEALQRQVAAAADVDLMRRYIYGLGIYNTSVHQALNYPQMRQQLLMGSLSSLANARGAQDFMARYSLVPIRMARQAGYELRRWTLPN
ncbi:MAG: NACHT domain-containing protein [Anaerolineales bacterium]|nr:NACHT domain-containing protein [Anaerolineales bacterium]